MSRSTTTGISSGNSIMSTTTALTTSSTTPSKMSSRRQIFLEIVQESNHACSNGDYASAVKLYTRALKIDPNNHILYSNRSAAFIKMGHFAKALQDALRARDLNPKWSKAYYRQGVALQCLGKHSEALAAFSSGLAQDPKSSQLLSGLIEAATKSPLKGKLEPIFTQLERMKLEKSVFVVISVIGQELLAAGYFFSAVIVLESGLKIGTANLKLKGSVFSALSSSYWALNSLEKAINYMQQDLGVAKSLGDTAGECRAHGNLGSAYFSKRNFKDALTSHRYQLVLAMKCKDTQAAAAALTSLGHVYTGIGDYANALASHQQCVQLMKQIGDTLQQAREIGNVGSVYLVIGDFDSAIDCHSEHLRLANELRNKVEEARAYSNLGSSYHYRRSYDKAISFHNQVLQIATELGDKSVEARAYAGLGHAARCMNDFSGAKTWHEKQLDMALSTKDKIGEGRALSNLGIVYQLLGEHESALKLHQAHLHLVISLSDRGGMGRAYGNIGNAYNALGYHDQAIKYHKQELAISKEVNDRNSEASTHGNLAVAYQALGHFEKALAHYHCHLNISRELKDGSGEACALLNLGNCHSSAGDFRQAIPFYENYLMVSQELSDVDGEAKACHFLGFAHYCLSNFKEAVRYYDQDLSIAKDLGNKANIGRAYCNLGLTHLALTNYDKALECQTHFLTLSHELKNVQCKFRALGNIGNVLLKMKREDEAVKIYQKQLMLGKTHGEKSLEASAYSSLGMAHRVMKQYDRALGFHSQELGILCDLGDVAGECRAHGNLGAVHMSLGNYPSAIQCYEEMLRLAKDLKDSLTEAQAFGNLGIGRMNMGRYEDGISFFEEQLRAFDRLVGGKQMTPVIIAEKGHAYNNLGDCLATLGKHKESVEYLQRALQTFQKLQNKRDQERTERSLGLGHRALGNQSEALKHFQRRLHLVSPGGAEAEAYGDLGTQYVELKNYEQGLSCFQTQLRISRERNSKRDECFALGNLGKCYEGMGDWTQALHYHEMELGVGEEMESAVDKSRAYGRIGFVYESLGKYDQAMAFYEEYLKTASQTTDSLAKATAFSSIGRIQHLFGNNIQAIAYLKQGLQIVETLEACEEEAKINHFLGLTFWRQDDLESAQTHLQKSINILEKVRETAPWQSDISLTLFDREIASYQALQRILVLMGKTDEALLFAEEARTIPHLTLLQSKASPEYPNSTTRIRSVEDLMQHVNKVRSAVLYFSLVGTFLYSWLLIPGRGVVKFNECSLNGEEDGDEEGQEKNMDTLLEGYVHGTHEALGLDFSPLEEGNDLGSDLWASHLEELGDKLNQENDKTGFLRMVSRNHRFNCSSYSLSSLFSTTGSVKSFRSESIRSRHRERTKGNSAWQGPSCLRSLYQMLISPFEDELNILDSTCFQELILVVETPLLTVPFSLLRSCTSEDYLVEKFKLIVTPCLSSIKINGNRRAHQTSPTFLVVGNPTLSESVREQWGWADLPRAETEATLVSQILKTDPLIGSNATKDSILNLLPTATCVHFSTHVSWKLSAIVLGVPSTSSPGLSEYLLTAAEILKIHMNAKLVVLSSYHGTEKLTEGVVNGESLIGLGKTLLASGVASVLISLWPSPEGASKLFFRAFYSALLEGVKVSHAMSEALLTLQQSKQFSHPANWAGYLLIGSDSRLTRNGALPGQAIWELIKTPERSKDALRVSLHLVEKSLQRISNGQKNAMYTTQKSIENKVGNVSGWKEILTSVGFRFEPSTNGLPAAVFFPQTDPGERLVKCSGCLQALLGLPPSPIRALSKLLATPEAGDEVIAILRQAISEMTLKDWDSHKVELRIDVKLWGIVGCHELLASLGFDLIEVGENEVILGIGKNVKLCMLQLALQATLSLFDALGADEEASFDGRLSLESLEFKTEECEIPPVATYLQPRHRQQLGIGMGQGAFTSYVRSRGEPDGHTNLSVPELKTMFPSNSLTPSESLPMNFSLASIINRPESTTSSGSSATDWENGLTTIRRRAPPPPTPKSHKIEPSTSDSTPPRAYDPKSMKRVTWKPTNESGKSSTSEQSMKPHKVSRDMLLSDVYHERNIDLDLAPPLSKILMSNRLNLSQVELSSTAGRETDLEIDMDPGTLSMDDTMSNFDQLSLAEDSAAEGSSTRLRIKSRTKLNSKLTLPPVPMKRTLKSRIATATATATAQLKVLSRDESSSSNSNSSKSSPSDLSKRDEGDGRSLTDSQYGSYSPSMAMAQTQNDLLQSLYFPPTKTTDMDGTKIEPHHSKKYTKDPPIRTGTINLSSFNNQKSTEC